MEKIKDALGSLAEEFEENLAEIRQSPETNVSVNTLKQASISIEGRIREQIQQARINIHRDDGIPSDSRVNALESLLNQIGINLDQMALARRSTVNAANAAINEMKRQSLLQRRSRLSEGEGKVDLSRAIRMKNTDAGTLASDVTKQLEHMRDLIRTQVAESRNAVHVMKESTAALSGIGDAAEKAEMAQGKAQKALWKLRISQNWDRYLLKSSLLFFTLVVCYVVYRGLTRNVIVDILRVSAKGGRALYRHVLKKNVVQEIVDKVPDEMTGAVDSME